MFTQADQCVTIKKILQKKNKQTNKQKKKQYGNRKSYKEATEIFFVGENEII